MCHFCLEKRTDGGTYGETERLPHSFYSKKCWSTWTYNQRRKWHQFPLFTFCNVAFQKSKDKVKLFITKRGANSHGCQSMTFKELLQHRAAIFYMVLDCQKIMGNLTYTSIKACIKLKKHTSILHRSLISHFLIITLSQAWDVASHLLNLELNVLASCLLMYVILVIQSLMPARKTIASAASLHGSISYAGSPHFGIL